MPLADVPLDAASPDAGLLPFPPHAAIAVLTSAAAPPVSAARRLIAASGCRSGASSRASCHSSRSSASLTGSSSDIVPPPQWGLGTRVLESGTTRFLSPRDCHCYRSHRRLSRRIVNANVEAASYRTGLGYAGRP